MEQTRRGLLGTVGGLGAAALAGCNGAGGGTPTASRAITYSVVNRDAGPHNVLLAATPNGVTGFQFTYADGSTETIEATGLEELPADAFIGAVALDPQGEGIDHRELTVTRGEQRRGSFDGLPAETRVFSYIAPEGQQIRSYGFAWCDEGRMELDVVVQTDSSYEETVECLGQGESGRRRAATATDRAQGANRSGE